MLEILEENPDLRLGAMTAEEMGTMMAMIREVHIYEHVYMHKTYIMDTYLHTCLYSPLPHTHNN